MLSTFRSDSSSLPEVLQEALQEARSDVSMDSERMLSADERYSIYGLLQKLSGPKSKRIRVQLSLLIAYYVLPVWNRVWPDDDLAETALTKAVEILGGRQNLEEAEAEASAMWETLEMRIQESIALSHLDALFAGAVAVNTLVETFWEHREGNAIYGRQEWDPASKRWEELWYSGCQDPSLWGVIAYAGGIGDVATNYERRQEFWDWWLTEAIPTAWVLVSEKD